MIDLTDLIHTFSANRLLDRRRTTTVKTSTDTYLSQRRSSSPLGYILATPCYDHLSFAIQSQKKTKRQDDMKIKTYQLGFVFRIQ